MGWFWTTILNGMLGLGGYWGARHVCRLSPGLPRGLGATVLAWTWMTLGMQVLGSLALLRLVPLAIWTASGLAVVAVFRLVRPNPETADLASPSWDATATSALGLVVWAVVAIGIPSLMLPVKVVSDAPIYHLYFAAKWWQAGRLFLVPLPFGESAATYFPAGGDLWFTWLNIGWGGDRLARIGQAPFLLLSAFAAFAMARRLGASTSSAVVATCWFVSCLPLLLFSFEANVDTIFIAGYLVATYFLLRYALDGGESRSLVMAGLAAGGAWGCKPTATLFIPVLLLLGVGLILARRAPASRTSLHLLLLVLAGLLPSAYWFGRSALLTGNPLYPLHLEAFGRVWLRGWYDRSAMQWSPFYIPRHAWQAFVDILLSVVDPRFLPFWLLSLLGVWSLGKRSQPLDRWVWGFSALAVLNIALYWIFIPYRTQQRFMLHALGLAVVPLSRFFDLDRTRLLRWAGVVLLFLHLATSQSWPFGQVGDQAYWSLSGMIPTSPRGALNLPQSPDEWREITSKAGRLSYLIGKLVFGLASLVVAWAWARQARRPSTRRLATAVTTSSLVVGLTAASIELAGNSATNQIFPDFPEYARAWRVLEDMTARMGGANVAYAGTNIPYYLMGKGLRNNVEYVNIDDHPGWLLHDYHRTASDRGDPAIWNTPRPGWDRIHPDREAWIRNLRSRQIQFLVVARANPNDGPFNIADVERFPIERVWADRSPQFFQPVYGFSPPDPNMKIYRVHLPRENATDFRARRH